MRKKALQLVTAAILCSPFLCTLSQAQSLPKLEVAKGETYHVAAGNLLAVDTLILHDKATIQFAPDATGFLTAKVAYVGKTCTISSKGQDGENGKNGLSGKSGSDFGNPYASVSTLRHGTYGHPGENGADGGDLELTIHFASLGSLTIDSRGGDAGSGGDGGTGAAGREERQETRTSTGSNGKQQEYTVTIPEQPGDDGGRAGEGGKPGNGGNVLLTYSTEESFTPVFNRKLNRNGISILFQAGKAGKHGKPGRGGRSAQNGDQVYTSVPSGLDGKVTLVNKNIQ